MRESVHSQVNRVLAAMQKVGGWVVAGVPACGGTNLHAIRTHAVLTEDGCLCCPILALAHVEGQREFDSYSFRILGQKAGLDDVLISCLVLAADRPLNGLDTRRGRVMRRLFEQKLQYGQETAGR